MLLCAWIDESVNEPRAGDAIDLLAARASPICLCGHSHMLRHACGFKLANDGHDTRAIQAYLGHRSIMSTVRYTALTPNRFKNFWKD